MKKIICDECETELDGEYILDMGSFQFCDEGCRDKWVDNQKRS